MNNQSAPPITGGGTIKGTSLSDKNQSTTAGSLPGSQMSNYNLVTNETPVNKNKGNEEGNKRSSSRTDREKKDKTFDNSGY